MNETDLRDTLDQSLAILRTLQTPRGLFLASAADVSTGYNKAWLRDNFYTSLAFERIGDSETVRSLWHALLDVFLKHEDKINSAIAERPHESYQYIHARYNPETFEEFWEEWGNKQNDAVGAVLYKLAGLATGDTDFLRSDHDRRVIQKLVDYLASVEYWQDPDSGVWEENEELHASSVGAALAGLKQASRLPFISMPEGVVEKGEEALTELLPRESKAKFADLALLSLIYPFDVVSRDMAETIIGNVSYHLRRDRGIIRYKNDRYYNKNSDGYSEEAEWTMGFSWLAIILWRSGRREEALVWLERALATRTPQGETPELYFSNSDRPNDNTPLAWSQGMLIVAICELFPDLVEAPKR